MASLTLAWEYLTGYAVATDPSTRDRVEWPPHPARVFMALAAAWFETEPSEDDERETWATEGDALRWIESLGDTELSLPIIDRSSERSNVTIYVPVNDRAGPSIATLQSCPAITRSKQARSFPRMWVGYEPTFLRWSNVEGSEQHIEALARLCRKVTRLGHSSSLVAMRLVSDDEDTQPTDLTRLVADDLQAAFQVRSLTTGTLDMLRERFGEEARQRHAATTEEIEALQLQRKSVKGNGASERKATIDEQVQTLKSQRDAFVPRPPIRPTTGLWTGYRRDDPPRSEGDHSRFDSDILVLSQEGGPTLPLTATLAVTKALRENVMSKGPQPVPNWVSGHAADGRPLRDDDGHLAIVPMPFVGHEHADGHLLGVAIVFPRSVEYKERGRVLGELLVQPDRLPKTVSLLLGSLGRWDVRKRDHQETRILLQPERWTAAPGGAKTWASVSPVVLDRFPKAERLKPSERSAWEEEVRAIIRAACTRIGLPEPDHVDIDATSWHAGSPRAVGKRRPLRGQPGAGTNASAALGDGFPPYPARGTNAPRPQVHVWLEFPRPVVGPVLLGAGRYLGYGLCKTLYGRNH